MTATERANKVIEDYDGLIDSHAGVERPASLRRLIETAITGAMKDQRHACAEAILAMPIGQWDIGTAHQAVLDAVVKG